MNFKRNFLKTGYVVATYPCNRMYLTEVTNKYGKRVSDSISSTWREAQSKHENIVNKYK